jgi:hypothetical protein
MARRRAGPEAERVRFTIYLPPETHQALMRRALEDSAEAGERISATKLVERLIDRYLSRGGSHGKR